MSVLEGAAAKLQAAADELAAIDFTQQKAEIADVLSSISISITTIAGAVQQAVAAIQSVRDDEPADEEEAPA